MEYIREVLERQEAALRRLLLGRREGETGAERTEEAARRAGREDTGREAAGRVPAAQETLRQALERRSAERRAEMAGGPGLAGPGTAPVPPAGQETGERLPIRREAGPAAETAARGPDGQPSAGEPARKWGGADGGTIRRPSVGRPERKWRPERRSLSGSSGRDPRPAAERRRRCPGRFSGTPGGTTARSACTDERRRQNCG